MKESKITPIQTCCRSLCSAIDRDNCNLDSTHQMYKCDIDRSKSISKDKTLCSSNRPRIVLTRKTARDIFQLKATNLHSASQGLASKYGVSSKTIRDIWNGKSWLEATYDLWSVDDRPARKTLGRPKGKKDSKPRMRGRNLACEANTLHLAGSRFSNQAPNRTSIQSSQGDKNEINFDLQQTEPISCADLYLESDCRFHYARGKLDLQQRKLLPSLKDVLAEIVAGYAARSTPPACLGPQLPPLAAPPRPSGQW